jgi:hypothetical protein
VDATGCGSRANSIRLPQERAREFEQIGVVGAQPIGQAGARKIGKDGKRERNGFIGRHDTTSMAPARPTSTAIIARLFMSARDVVLER